MVTAETIAPGRSMLADSPAAEAVTVPVTVVVKLVLPPPPPGGGQADNTSAAVSVPSSLSAIVQLFRYFTFEGG